jgi:flagellar export protein FliJ
MPKRFCFALQPLLDQRKLLETEKRVGAERCRGERDDALAAVERLASAVALCARLLRESVGGMAPVDPRVLDGHLRLLGRALAERRRAAQEHDAAFKRARAEFVAAATARRIVERLEERQRRRFDVREARIGERELDETNGRLA